MENWQLILLGAIGCVAGFINVLAGGGSLLTMSTMVFLGLGDSVANGTNRVANLAQNISAVTGFARKGFSDFKLSLSLAACALPGATIGAYLGTNFEGIWFKRALAGVMVTVLILMAVKRRKKKSPGGASNSAENPGKPKRLVLGHLLMVAAGFYGGIIQAGVGFILMPILHRVMGLDLVRVNMHKVFIVGAYTVPALSIFAWKGDVRLVPGLSLAVGMALGAWFGSHFAVKKGEKAIRVVLYIALTAMAAKLLLFS